MLLLVSLVFSVLFVLPADPAQIILGINASPATLAALRSQLGLDQPFWIQYGQWIGGLLHGVGGRSITYDVPVAELIATRLAVTGPLALMAMVIAVVLALPLGIFAARHHRRPGDATIMAATQVGWPSPNSGSASCSCCFFPFIGAFSLPAGFPAGGRICRVP